MKLFPYGHATHPQWEMAAGLVLAQLRAHMALPEYADAPTLGLIYITDHYAMHAQDILLHLSDELPEVTDWAGTVGVGIAANNVEYFDEPALSVMLCDISPELTACSAALRHWPKRAWARSAAAALCHTRRCCMPMLKRLMCPS